MTFQSLDEALKYSDDNKVWSKFIYPDYIDFIRSVWESGYDKGLQVNKDAIEVGKQLERERVRKMIESARIVGTFDPYTDERYEQDAINSLIVILLESLT